MFEETVSRPSRWRTFWPDVSDVAGAGEAIQLGSWLAFLTAVVNAGAAVLMGLSGGSLNALVDAGCFGLIGVGLRRSWRWVAVVGLSLTLVGFVYTISQGGVPGFIGIVTLVGMVNAVRGTFALKRLKRAPHQSEKMGAIRTGAG
jgi:hypothetical protein